MTRDIELSQNLGNAQHNLHIDVTKADRRLRYECREGIEAACLAVCLDLEVFNAGA